MIAILVGATLASGCYTVLRHPNPQGLVAEETGARKACEDCHQDSRFYHDAFDPHHYGFGDYWAHARWSDYYYRPWWYADYWYYGQDGASEVETGGQHLWGDPGRRTFREPNAPVIGGGQGGNTVPPVAPVAPGTSGGSGSAGSGSGPTVAPKEETRYREAERRTLRTPEPPKTEEEKAREKEKGHKTPDPKKTSREGVR
jgi:hypothetical protein